MNEKLAKVKEFLIKLKDKTIEVSKKIYDILKQHPLITAVVGFALISIIVACVAVFAMKEFVVSVCILIVLEVFMAAFLHRAEIWKHGILLVAQILAAIIIKRIPLMILMILVYVAATGALGLIATAKAKEIEKADNTKQIEKTPKTENTKQPGKKVEQKRKLNKKGPKA